MSFKRRHPYAQSLITADNII